MWIIPKNLDVSACVRDTLDSNWESGELSLQLEQSVMWRSKPSLARTWLARLKRVNWMQLLSGRILRPSMDDHFTKGYTSLLRVIPVSRSVLPARDKEQMTHDTFGRILKESFRQYSLFGSSEKTSVDTLPLDSPQFIEAYIIWVTKLRQDCLQRQSAALHIREKDCLSWPTSRVSDTEGGLVSAKATQTGFRNPSGHGSKLKEAVAEVLNWRTPAEQPAAIKTDKLVGELGKRMYHKETGRLAQYGLEQQVNWPTPQASEHKGQSQRGQHRPDDRLTNKVISGLLDQDSPSTNGKSFGLYPTPAMVDGGSYFNKSESIGATLRPTLGALAKYNLWMTPESKNQQGYQVMNGKQYPRLGKQAKGKLNPDWVEQLMGLCVGWTDLGYWETG